MDQEILNRGALILYRKIQIAVAFYLIERCPPNKDIEKFANEFQLEVRQQSTRYNLYLERKILCEQLSHLCSINLNNPKWRYPIPMEVDIISPLIDHRQFLDSQYSDLTIKLSVTTELLEAAYETKLLLEETDSISSKDILHILAKFHHLEINNHIDLYDDGKVIQIFRNAFQSAIKLVNMEKLITECIRVLVRYFKLYLTYVPEKSSLSMEEVLKWMKKANHILIKCIDKYARDSQHQNMIISLLQDSINEVFFGKHFSSVQLQRYRKIIRKWKDHKFLCINVLNMFINYIGEKHKSENEDEMIKCELVVRYIETFLRTYCEKHLRKHAFPVDGRCCRKSERKMLTAWAKVLAGVNVEFRNMNLQVQAWKCFNIILMSGELESFRQRIRAR